METRILEGTTRAAEANHVESLESISLSRCGLSRQLESECTFGSTSGDSDEIT